MNDMIARLVAEFSREKNVTQREIIEAAIVEFLCNLPLHTPTPISVKLLPSTVIVIYTI